RNRRTAFGYFEDRHRTRDQRRISSRRNAPSYQRHHSRSIRRLQTNCRSQRRHRPLHRLDPHPIRHSRLLQRSVRNFEEQRNRSSDGEMNIVAGIPNFDAAVVEHARKDFPLLDANMTVGTALARIRREGVGERVIYFYVVDERERPARVLPMLRLLTASPEALMSEIMVLRVIVIPV